MDKNATPQPVSPQPTEQEAQAAVQQVMPPENKPGRKALTIFALAVLMCLVGYGVYVWQNTRVTTLQTQVDDLKKEAATKTLTKADPYAGWKTYTTKYEKLSFKYPSDFTVSDKSTAGGNVTPGTDLVTVTSSTGLSLKIWTGVDGIGGACIDCKIVKSESMTVLDKSVYLNYVDRGQDLVSSLELATDKKYTSSGLFNSKNIKVSQGNDYAVNLYSIYYVKNDGTISSKSIETYTADATLADIKLVLESFNY